MTMRRARSPLRFAALICFGLILVAPGPAAAARLALLVGNDEGQGPDATLHFAESDTTRMAALLTRVGGFAADATIVKLGGTADDLRRALAGIATRLRATPGDHLVVVFYSGHADGQTLHLGRSSFSMAELKETVNALPAAARVLIVDACQAGVMTRSKGGRAGVGFPLDAIQAADRTRGLAILASSAGSELAQESDQLGSAVFTHYLHAGLSGLADRDHDGGVSLAEVFDYASDRTLAATLGTATGPQHPTFRLDIEGSDALVLTRPGATGPGYGRLRMDVPGWYFIRRGDGTIAAELVSSGGETLAIEPGPYEITRRGHDSLDVASVAITGGEALALSHVPTHPVAFGRMVRKGGGPSAAYALMATTAARTSVEDLGLSLGFAVAARADLSALSVELRLAAGRAQADAPHLSTTTWEGAASVAVLRARDFGGNGRASLVTVSIGIEVGLSVMEQRLDLGERHRAFSPFAGPTVLAEMAMSRRFFLRAGASVPVYALAVERPSGGATAWRPSLSATLGAGTWF